MAADKDKVDTREQESRNAREAERTTRGVGGVGIGAGEPGAPAAPRGTRPGGINSPPTSPATGEDGGDPVPPGPQGTLNTAVATPRSGEADVMRKRREATPVLRTTTVGFGPERQAFGPHDKLPKPSKAAKSENGRKVRLHGALDTTRVEGGPDGDPMATTFTAGVYDAGVFSESEFEMGVQMGILTELSEDEDAGEREREKKRKAAEKGE